MMKNNESNILSQDSAQRKKLEQGGRLHFVHWLVISLSLFLTVAAWYFSSEQILQKNKAKFDREADQVIRLVKERMELYEHALWGGVALIDSNNGEMSYEQWLAYSESLNIDQAYPGINGIGVIYNIQPSEMETYLARERKSRPDYALHPQHNETEYWPITYIEPALPNKKAVGLDMAFETNRYTSVKKARDEGSAQVTGPITLVQDAKKTPGFLFYTPFYKGGGIPRTIEERRRDIIGVTYAPFIMHKLMQGTLARNNRHVLITISDEDTLLYDDSQGSKTSEIDKNPLFTKTMTVDMYGRQWKFDIAAGSSFRSATNNSQPYWILIAGGIIDSLLIGLFLFLSRTNRRALSYADQMTAALVEKSDRLEEASRVKTEFLSVMSHELRTPLTSIRGALGLLSSGVLGEVPDKVEKTVQIATQNSVKLARLVDDILDIDKLSSHHVSFNKTDVIIDNLVSSVVRNSLPYAGEFKVNLVTDLHSEGTSFATDEGRLDQVITNLLSNAIKFSPEGASVIVTTQVENSIFRLEVVDSGRGIPENFKDSVFDRFSQADSSDNRIVGGTGLGLNICKSIIDALEGRIGFTDNDNENGVGTTFYIEFDL